MTNEEMRAVLAGLRSQLEQIEDAMQVADRTPFGDLGKLLDGACLTANLAIEAIDKARVHIDADAIEQHR